MDASSINNIPWELIIGALQNNLSDQEQEKLQQWLTSGAENQDTYNRIRQLWEEDLMGYTYYKAANENNAWQALRSKMERREPGIVTPAVVQIGRSRKQQLMRWGAIAAAVLVLVGAGLLWWIYKPDITMYQTAMNESKQIILPDSSTVLLQPQSRMIVSQHFNKTNRTIMLEQGAALFDVKHKSLPFIVDMEKSSVRDLGTSFSIRKGADSIKVTVMNGKVAFTKKATKETLELSAGMMVSSDTKEGNFGRIALVDVSLSGVKPSLHFSNTALADVVVALEKVHGKRIVLENNNVAAKRLGAQLDGVDFERALKIICTSLNLEYVEKDGVYTLKEKK